ncbi:Holliday junction resolvase RuvX [Chloroflexota bacterium]
MGLDIGDKRIGVALSDPQGILASPFTIIERRDEAADVAAITGIIDQNQVNRVIVGLPLSMDGGLGQQAKKIEDFAQKLRHQTKAPVEFRDERLTTVWAKYLRRDAGIKKTRTKVRYDAAAAALILQGYLDEGRGVG